MKKEPRRRSDRVRDIFKMMRYMRHGMVTGDVQKSTYHAFLDLLNSLNMARLIAQRVSNPQEKSYIFREITQVTREDQDLQPIIDLWERGDLDLAMKDEIGLSLLHACFFCGKMREGIQLMEEVFIEHLYSFEAYLKALLVTWTHTKKKRYLHAAREIAGNGENNKERALGLYLIAESTKEKDDLIEAKRALSRVITSFQGEPEIDKFYARRARVFLWTGNYKKARQAAGLLGSQELCIEVKADIVLATKDKGDLASLMRDFESCACPGPVAIEKIGKACLSARGSDFVRECARRRDNAAERCLFAGIIEESMGGTEADFQQMWRDYHEMMTMSTSSFRERCKISAVEKMVMAAVRRGHFYSAHNIIMDTPEGNPKSQCRGYMMIYKKEVIHF